MHTDHVAHNHSVWADLEALVLEEVDALAQPPSEVPEQVRFGSEDEFVAEAAHYLRQRPDPVHLIDQLCAELGIDPGGAESRLGEEFESDNGGAESFDGELPQALHPADPQSAAGVVPPAPDSATT